MKRKFYFHRQNCPLDTDHVVYVLWCGESVREQKMLAKMVAWSFEHGATLRSWSEDIDYYLMLESERVFPNKGLLDFGFVKAHINASELLTLMEDESFESYEKALCVPKAYFHQIQSVSPASVDRRHNEIKNSFVLTLSSKNLSQTQGAQPTIISFV